MHEQEQLYERVSFKLIVQTENCMNIEFTSFDIANDNYWVYFI